VFIFQFLVYFTSKVGELKALHIMCKSVKVAPESVLSNRGKISKGRVLCRRGFRRGGGYLRTPVPAVAAVS